MFGGMIVGLVKLKEFLFEITHNAIFYFHFLRIQKVGLSTLYRSYHEKAGRKTERPGNFAGCGAG